MALINQPQESTVFTQIKNMSTDLLGQMKNVATQQFNLVWNNPIYSAQEVIDMFGVEACAAMDAHAALQTLIYTVDNSWVPLIPPLEYSRNQDGTITVL